MPVSDKEVAVGIIAGLIATIAGMVAWINNRLHNRVDRKLSKEVFDRFREENCVQHKDLRASLGKKLDLSTFKEYAAEHRESRNRIEDKIDKILIKLPPGND